MNTYTYELNGNLYINLTNKCSNQCVFCVRNDKDSYFGHSLWLYAEPTDKEVLEQIKDVNKYDEIVFCGFGEPTYRLDVMLKVAYALKSRGAKTIRLNTNGYGSKLNGYNVVQDLAGAIDFVSISLNAGDKQTYNDICKPKNANAFDELVDFAKSCKRDGLPCRFTVVDCIGEEQLNKCRALADDIGIPLSVRTLITNS